MKTKNILFELIEYLDQFESENQHKDENLNMSDFLGYLNSQYKPMNVKTRELGGNYEGYKYKEQKGDRKSVV